MELTLTHLNHKFPPFQLLQHSHEQDSVTAEDEGSTRLRNIGSSVCYSAQKPKRESYQPSILYFELSSST